MCSESVLKYFKKSSDILPLSTYGLSTVEEFSKAEGERSHQEWLKKAGLNDEEILLLNEIQTGFSKRSTKIESSVLKIKLQCIKNKLNSFHHDLSSLEQNNEDISKDLKKQSVTFYPEGHPIHKLRELEECLFGHFNDDQLPISKRRKILRRLERRKQKVISNQIPTPVINDHDDQQTKVKKIGSLWDVKEMSFKTSETKEPALHKTDENNVLIGPRKPTMYTVKDNKIVRLEHLNDGDEVKAVDIVIPVNSAEVQLLEGTKMSLANIKTMDRFKNYTAGIPSKVLYLKNIAPSVTQDSLLSLFKQFMHDNGGPIDVKLMSGRMRGQAFAAFQNETIAKQALEEVNGTILKGRPVIVQFGKNSNRIQSDEPKTP